MNVEIQCITCKKKLSLDWPDEDGVLEFSVMRDLMSLVLKDLFDHHGDTRQSSSDIDVRDALAQTHSSGHSRYRFVQGVTVEFAREYEIEVHGSGATIT